MLYQRGQAYSQDLRERVFAGSDDGERVGEVADLLRVSVSYVSKALTRSRTMRETTVRSGRGHKPPLRCSRTLDSRHHQARRGTRNSCAGCPAQAAVLLMRGRPLMCLDPPAARPPTSRLL